MVDPAVRGEGVAKAVLTRLQDEARVLGRDRDLPDGSDRALPQQRLQERRVLGRVRRVADQPLHGQADRGGAGADGLISALRGARRRSRQCCRTATESYDRLLLALDQLLQEAQRVGDAGVREWASLAMLDAIDFAEELGMMWNDEAERRRAAVSEGFGDLDQR